MRKADSILGRNIQGGRGWGKRLTVAKRQCFSMNKKEEKNKKGVVGRTMETK
jgi:hypothetical protein